jgi:hypothetical protein
MNLRRMTVADVERVHEIELATFKKRPGRCKASGTKMEKKPARATWWRRRTADRRLRRRVDDPGRRHITNIAVDEATAAGGSAGRCSRR